ncbi:hypothetical protein RUM44_007320 [Polyplax serrata]|uniref:Uncharacterized protein n=1 Tax=Polyplax serrata TaxID=468196 RepID=A0ABR1B0U0_POLSC
MATSKGLRMRPETLSMAKEHSPSSEINSESSSSENEREDDFDIIKTIALTISINILFFKLPMRCISFDLKDLKAVKCRLGEKNAGSIECIVQTRRLTISCQALV